MLSLQIQMLNFEVLYAEHDSRNGLIKLRAAAKVFDKLDDFW